MVAQITGCPCDVCLDPTLMTDASLWNPLLTAVEKEEYVLMYEVRWNPQTKGLLRKKAEELAEKAEDLAEKLVKKTTRKTTKKKAAETDEAAEKPVKKTRKTAAKKTEEAAEKSVEK